MAIIKNYSLQISTEGKEEVYVPYFDYTIRETDDSLLSLVVVALNMLKMGITPIAALFIPQSAKGNLPQISDRGHEAIKQVQDGLKLLLEREVGFDIRCE